MSLKTDGIKFTFKYVDDQLVWNNPSLHRNPEPRIKHGLKRTTVSAGSKTYNIVAILGVLLLDDVFAKIKFIDGNMLNICLDNLTVTKRKITIPIRDFMGLGEFKQKYLGEGNLYE